PFSVGGFGSAQHTMPGERFRKIKDFANRVLPRYIRNATLWILLNGSKDPDAKDKTKIGALQKFWDTTVETDFGNEQKRYNNNKAAYGALPWFCDGDLEDEISGMTAKENEL